MAVWTLEPIQVDEQRARAYVLARGNAQDVARLEGIMVGTAPERAVVKQLEERQNQDGGFVPVVGKAPTLEATCQALIAMRGMPPLSGSPMASRAVSFLRRHQGFDGSWAPLPGDGQETHDLTACATFLLATYDPDHLDPISRGATWLSREMEAGRLAGTRALAPAWAVWYRVLGADAPETVESFRSLTGNTPASEGVAWWLYCALEAGAGGRYLLPLAQYLSALAAQQQADGSWPGELESTLLALQVYRGYGIL